uniref:Retrovirus-related Pol polyprotein from transposon TNT 1-94 n=1 Tax=Tanacetum cinerariifolium TaxID=118510 RepID=A0A699K333_TANCI|nr:hypothetical protein [Tanacetum cinerariifolium]
MFGTIPPPSVPNPDNIENPNRVEHVFELDTTTNNGTNNVINNVVGKDDLHQLLDSRGGSHVINISQIDVEDFTSWKDSDSDVGDDTNSSSEFLADLNAQFHDRALLANQKRVKAFIAIAKDEPVMGKTDTRSGQWVEITIKRGKRKETISLKEIVFTKGENSPSKTLPDITFDTKSVDDKQVPLPPLPKLLGVEPIGISYDVIPPADMIQTYSLR